MSLHTYKNIIKSAFDSQNWNYSTRETENGKFLFSINFTNSSNNTTIKCSVLISDDGICDIEAILPFTCTQENIGDVIVLISEHNYSKRYATLRVDFSDGEINNSYSFDFNESTTPNYFLKRFISVKDIDDDETFGELEKLCFTTPIETSNTPEPQSSTSSKNKFKLNL